MELIGFIQVFNIIIIAIGTLLYMCCRPSSAADSDVADSAADSTAVADVEDADIPPRREKYDVFISFGGEDTRLGITSHLHDALLQKKIETYMDNRLQSGDEIGPALLEIIEKSTISVIVFSQNYASSTRCLDELVHILKCNERYGQMVVPVFYDINPSDVRKQHGTYADAFAQLEKRFDNSIDKVHKWRDALKTAANLCGFDYSNKSWTKADLIQKVVDHICLQLCHESSCDLNGFVGIESRIEQIELLLGIHSQDACITVGIWGMGGIGKTTLAETVFHKLSSKFEASCFLKNVRKNSEEADGLDRLENELLKEILKEEGLSIGSTSVRKRLSRTKVLIVLDDASDSKQIKRLAGNSLRFGTGSRIIITSRDKSTLGQTVEEDNIYEVEVLKPDDAFQLFCSRAFKNNSTRRRDYKESAEKVVHYARGVPLALTVLGSLFFNCKSKEDWEDEFNKLKRFPSESIQKVFRISYDRLEINEKEIFLDIACFYKGRPMDEVNRMLDGRGYFVTTGIRILVDMSLISIDSKWGRETIEMHDLLQEMGRAIVQEQCIKDPSKRSRLFNAEDFYCGLKSNMENVEATFAKWSKIKERPLKRADFKKMSNLTMLRSFDSAAVADDEDADIPPRREKYDVFISFRGEDTRLTFTSHLHDALLRKKIETYVDNRLQRGDEIGPALLEAIEKSTISVIVFSQNYASSTWCLDELVHILKCAERYGQMVIPVFYDINPSDVRKQHGTYADAFAQLEKCFDNSIDKVHKWRDALKTAANLSGFHHSENARTDADLIKAVVKDIWTKLCRKSSYDLKGFVGIESRIEQIESLLGIHSPDACITVGIWGMGGIGKTTLAEAVFHRLSSKFEASCFVKNVRKNSEQADGLDHLENELLKEILKEEGLSIGSTSVRKRLSRTKVLIVLDDVSDSKQIKRFAGDRLRYGIGSRIIITSRDSRTLGQTVEKDKIYEVQGLKLDDALQLFCSRAFKNNSTRRTDYKELAKKVVDYARGVPLALIVLGSMFFNCKSKQDWENEFNKLKRSPSESIQRVLRLSYDGLERHEKEIFLDLACFHQGRHVDMVKRMLNVRGFFARAGIRFLIDMSFISTDSKWGRETIEMHDLLKEMGRTIVQEQCIEDPSKRNRLFTDEDVYRVLKNNRETPIVEAIRVNWSKIEEGPLKHADFKKMSNLIMLIVDGGCKFTASLDLPDSLRYLYWPGYPLESLPSKFSPENLVELHMPYSKVKKLWKEDQILVNLQVIDLSNSEYLTEVPNLSGSLKIEEINLEGCGRLVEIPSHFQHLDKLTHLNLGACSSPKYLPKIPGNLPEIPGNLTYLKSTAASSIFDNCIRFSKFPENLKPMEHLVSLSLKGTAVEMLPSSIGNLNSLQDLTLSFCEQLKDVPTSIYSLTNLKRLDFYGCGRLEKLPSSSIGFLSLEELDLSYSGILEIPASIKQASRLSVLYLINCKQLQSIPELPVLCNVNAQGCTSLKIVSSSRTALTQGWDKPNYCFRYFTNCPKLDNNSRSNIMDEAERHFWLNPWPQINIVCPGKEIPNWFSYQNEGSSVDIELCPDWFRTGLFGFALSVVVSEVPKRLYFRLTWVRANFIVKFMGESHELFSSNYIIQGSYDGQRHVHVWNEAFRSEEVGKNCSSDVYKLAKEASVVFYPVDLKERPDSASHMKVESCGICPLYAEDAEKFKFGQVLMSRGPK